jgi:hypothetical protein
LTSVTTTERGQTSRFRLTVLNPGGRDPHQDFSSRGRNPDEDQGHAPINFHAYAACTGGVFHRETRHAVAEGLPVLLLLRGDFRETQRALASLKRHRLPVAVSLKETGLHQIAKQLSDPKRARRFHETIQMADGCLAATSESLPFYGRGRFIPTPYPLDAAAWNFSRPLGERRGVFIGTREWNVPSRNHLAALLLALELAEPVTLFDSDPKRCRRILGALGRPTEALRILDRRLSYRAWLAEMARHRIVLQADRSSVPGQIAGDALLCRIPCVGGDGAIDRIAFPETCGFGRSLNELSQLAHRLLSEDNFYTTTVEQAQARARAQLGFAPVAQQLAEFFGSLTR